MRKLGVIHIVLLAAIVSALLWAALEPRKPNLPGYQHRESANAEYRPGGGSCQPNVLAAIRDDSKAASERQRCAEATEDNRLKRENLIQQSRAADAAQAQAIINYDLARMAMWGTIGGFLTLIAAAVAAYFARDASRASWELLKVEQAKSASDVRLQIYFETKRTDSAPQWITIFAKSHVGAKAAEVSVTDVTVTTTDDRFIGLPLTESYSEGPYELSHVGASRKFQFSDPSFVFPDDQMSNGAFDNIQIHVEATLNYIDPSGQRQKIPQRWAASVTTIRSPMGPYETRNLQATLERIA